MDRQQGVLSGGTQQNESLASMDDSPQSDVVSHLDDRQVGCLTNNGGCFQGSPNEGNVPTCGGARQRIYRDSFRGSKAQCNNSCSGTGVGPERRRKRDDATSDAPGRSVLAYTMAPDESTSNTQEEYDKQKTGPILQVDRDDPASHITSVTRQQRIRRVANHRASGCSDGMKSSSEPERSCEDAIKYPSKKRFKGFPKSSSNNNKMHPRSRHSTNSVDYGVLGEKYPKLKKYLAPKKYAGFSLDMTTTMAIYELSKAIMMEFYGLKFELPLNDGHFLVPCIPSRANYIHHIADLLVDVEKEGALYLALHGRDGVSSTVRHAVQEAQPLRGKHIKVLDIGVGANCVYPLLGCTEYGWTFVGSDISERSLELARENVNLNGLGTCVHLRHQQDPAKFFSGVVESGELFALSMCNPPFHESTDQVNVCPFRVLEAQNHEVVCEGGELNFIMSMIRESRAFCSQFMWFTSLVARASTLKTVKKFLWEELRAFADNPGQVEHMHTRWKSTIVGQGGQVSSGDEAQLSLTTTGVPLRVTEFRCKELYQGKQTRWVICWTFWTREQRKQVREFFEGSREVSDAAATDSIGSSPVT
ncbi:UNVERIFIED_CONTAM: 23S rRNA (adenine(1618)-N(6))-methyltransferase, putative [Hammondia hammondi]|eukprot:XP_008885578.1 23S rRNA (adenine(1618)-N(6))-methyltransferase, putative [Hammondia hammondi]